MLGDQFEDMAVQVDRMPHPSLPYAATAVDSPHVIGATGVSRSAKAIIFRGRKAARRMLAENDVGLSLERA